MELPEVNFTNYLIMIQQEVLIHLGLIINPITQKIEKNLALAQFHISLLEMIQLKTNGNLTQEEDGIMKQLLSYLQIEYVKAVDQK